MHEDKRNWTEKKMEGKSLYIRDGGLKPDKQERRRNFEQEN